MPSDNRYSGQGEAALARDALYIWEGACNPRALGRVLVDMIDWYSETGGGSDGPRGKAPIALVQGQLLFLLDMGSGEVPSGDMWALVQQCRAIVATAEVPC
jgi:hypothetical protein